LSASSGRPLLKVRVPTCLLVCFRGRSVTFNVAPLRSPSRAPLVNRGVVESQIQWCCDAWCFVIHCFFVCRAMNQWQAVSRSCLENVGPPKTCAQPQIKTSSNLFTLCLCSRFLRTVRTCAWRGPWTSIRLPTTDALAHGLSSATTLACTARAPAAHYFPFSYNRRLTPQDTALQPSRQARKRRLASVPSRATNMFLNGTSPETATTPLHWKHALLIAPPMTRAPGQRSSITTPSAARRTAGSRSGLAQPLLSRAPQAPRAASLSLLSSRHPIALQSPTCQELS
jgi:hypothetical protein